VDGSILSLEEPIKKNMRVFCVLILALNSSISWSQTSDVMTIRMHRVGKKNSLPAKVTQTSATKVRAKLESSKKVVSKAPSAAIAKMASAWLQNVELSAASAPTTPLAKLTGLVIAGQFILVPFDSISSISLHRGEPRYFVGPSRQEAQLVEFDLGGNQAILYVRNAYPSSLAPNSVRNSWPRNGEAITIFQAEGTGRFLSKINELNSDGILGRFSIPPLFETKDSESFAFDQEANFIGLRSRYQEDYSPAFYTQTLLSRAMKKMADHQPASVVTVAMKLREQWISLQERWAATLMADKASLQIQKWRVGLGTKMLKCQPLRMRLGDRGLSSLIDKAEGQECSNRATTTVDVGYQPGIETMAGVGGFRKKVDAGQWASLTDEMAKSFFVSFNADVETVSLFSSPECQESAGHSQNGTELRVSYCTSPLKPEAGLSDSVVFVAARSPADESFAFSGLRMKGFDKKNSTALLLEVMENLRTLK
jgi:hypothetical protein